MCSRRGPQESAHIFLNTSSKSRCGERPFERRHVLERIETKWLRADGIEVEQITFPLLGNCGEYLFGQVAVRVEQRHAFAARDVLPDQGLEERGLPRPGLPDHVHMRPAIGSPDAEDAPLVAVVGPGKEHSISLVWRSHLSIVARRICAAKSP